MKVSELNRKEVASYCRIDDDAADIELIDSLFLPAAKAYIRSNSNLTNDDMDKYEDIPIAVCALCSHMYDNRSVEVTSDKVNEIVMNIIGKYDRNLIPVEVAE